MPCRIALHRHERRPRRDRAPAAHPPVICRCRICGDRLSCAPGGRLQPSGSTARHGGPSRLRAADVCDWRRADGRCRAGVPGHPGRLERIHHLVRQDLAGAGGPVRLRSYPRSLAGPAVVIDRGARRPADHDRSLRAGRARRRRRACSISGCCATTNGRCASRFPTETSRTSRLPMSPTGRTGCACG